MSAQPKALALADQLAYGPIVRPYRPTILGAAAELRRLHAVNAELLEALAAHRALIVEWNDSRMRAGFPSNERLDSLMARADAAIARAQGSDT